MAAIPVFETENKETVEFGGTRKERDVRGLRERSVFLGFRLFGVKAPLAGLS